MLFHRLIWRRSPRDEPTPALRANQSVKQEHCHDRQGDEDVLHVCSRPPSAGSRRPQGCTTRDKTRSSGVDHASLSFIPLFGGALLLTLHLPL